MQRMRLLDLIHNLLAVPETAVYLEYCITNEELNYEYWLVPTFSSVPSLHQEVNEMLIFFYHWRTPLFGFFTLKNKPLTTTIINNSNNNNYDKIKCHVIYMILTSY